ncbi:MAG TPA: hypothetical protein DDY86_09300, partial [Syntrophaceae bacterium]|nr:hypothetical protein [Syntrophaceae bacterium]
MKKNAVLTSLLLIFFIPVLLFAQMPGGIGGAINAPKTQKTETIHWRNITNKPNTFPPAPHTHPGGTHDHANLTILDDISAPYTSAEQSKLSGIAAGAEVNVNADWNSGSGDSQILNKPTLGDAATKNVGTGAGDVSAGNHGHTQLHTQGTDQALDTGGENEISAANAKAAYTHSGVAHAPSDAVSLATVKADADVASAISLKHTAGTDQGLDTGGVNAVTAAQAKTAYSHSQAAHAPSDAQKNSDISKAEIEAKLTGEISSHTHAGGGGGDNFTIQTVTGDVVNNNASANTLANVTGLTFAVTSG